MKQLPNIISVARFIFSCFLLLCNQSPILFLTAYLLCGLSDVLDGYTARKYKWESRAGEQLDSLSDFVFYVIVIYLLITSTDILGQLWLIVGIIATFIIRIANLIITKAKFHTWGMLHSWGNKGVGLFLYVYIAITFWYGMASFISGVFLCLAAILSAVEEMVILISSEEYDANRGSFFTQS